MIISYFEDGVELLRKDKGSIMKRWIHASNESIIDQLSDRVTKGRADALRNIQWNISEDDIKKLAGVVTHDPYYEGFRFRNRGVESVDYGPEDDSFIVEYEDGGKSLFKYVHEVSSYDGTDKFYLQYVKKM